MKSDDELEVIKRDHAFFEFIKHNIIFGVLKSDDYGTYVRNDKMQRNFYLEPKMKLSIKVSDAWVSAEIRQRHGRGFDAFIDDKKIEVGNDAKFIMGGTNE